ncbi:MAG: hypothetical protein KKB59_20095 [Spirochaetes bacterium]|nr:hypothetical protein [Spirochaetota bacterium]
MKKVSADSLVPVPIIEQRFKDTLVHSELAPFLGKTKAEPLNVEAVYTKQDGEKVAADKVQRHYAYFTPEGKMLSDDEEKKLEFWLVKEDGSSEQVRPFERTASIEVQKTVSLASIDTMLEESTYELYHDDEAVQRLLYEEAEYFLQNDWAGIALFTWGRGFKQFYAIVRPLVIEGKFVWVMTLSQTAKKYLHLMPVPGEKVPAKELPTLELPQLEAIITTR